jgi:adenine-specific DNA-methyltransferase
MPTLNWFGKDKVINHHQDVPFRVLERSYAYGEPDTGNMIIKGNNLHALKALLPQYFYRTSMSLTTDSTKSARI